MKQINCTRSGPFVDDMKFEGMVFGALKFSDHPAGNISINIDKAEKIGIIRIITAKDIPG